MLTILLSTIAAFGLFVLVVSLNNWCPNDDDGWSWIAVMLWGATAVVWFYIGAFLALPG